METLCQVTAYIAGVAWLIGSIALIIAHIKEDGKTNKQNWYERKNRTED